MERNTLGTIKFDEEARTKANANKKCQRDDCQYSDGENCRKKT